MLRPSAGRAGCAAEKPPSGRRGVAPSPAPDRPNPAPRRRARSSGRYIAARLCGGSVDRLTLFRARGSTAPVDPGVGGRRRARQGRVRDAPFGAPPQLPGGAPSGALRRRSRQRVTAVQWLGRPPPAPRSSPEHPRRGCRRACTSPGTLGTRASRLHLRARDAPPQRAREVLRGDIAPRRHGGPRDRHLLRRAGAYAAATDPGANGSRAGRRASARPAAASCETSIERARRGMRPEAGARYADRVRGRALHHLRKHCIGRTRSPYARAWRADGRLAVLLPACQIALLRAVCEAGVISDRRARCDVFERTRRCASM